MAEKKRLLYALLVASIFGIAPLAMFRLARPTSNEFLYWVGGIISVLFMPGFVAGFATSGNIHVGQTWIVALGNFVFYLGVTYFILGMFKK